LPVVQATPSALRGMQLPPEQKKPAAHAVSLMHVEGQLAPVPEQT
jgi:hypothetical protein